jgi:hypothetical protein
MYLNKLKTMIDFILHVIESEFWHFWCNEFIAIKYRIKRNERTTFMPLRITTHLSTNKQIFLKYSTGNTLII